MMNPFRTVTGCKVVMNESLDRHTSFHIGGPARFLITVLSIRALVRILKVSDNNGFPICLLGAGTNILFKDEGFKGVVLKLKGRFTKIEYKKGYFCCGAGAMIDRMLFVACDLGYGGAEFLAGIPGSIGGAIYGNAGAFGRAISDITETVTVMTRRGTVRIMKAAEVGFGYRSSGLRRDNIVLSSVFRLRKSRSEKIRKQLQEKKIYRREHQPNGWSAGSFFKNPRPFSAGKLIDECGLKGVCIGDAMVSMKHANWIINKGSASARDIMELASSIKRTVKQHRGIVLKEEVRILK